MAVAYERTGVSNRDSAISTNTILEDVEILTPDDCNGIADWNKIGRQQIWFEPKNLRSAAETVVSNENIRFYFDGKNEYSLTSIKIGAVTANKLVLEEYYTLILDPNFVYKYTSFWITDCTIF